MTLKKRLMQLTLAIAALMIVGQLAAQLPDLNSDVLLSPYDDGIDGNPVGELQELCMNRRMQPPAYDVSSEEGQPHERNFVIVCSVGKHRESGDGKSKKIAKRRAAHKMLKRLQIHPVENDDQFVVVDEDDLASSIAQKMKAMRLKDAKQASQPKEGSVMARMLAMTREEYARDALGLLKAICDEEHYSVTFVDIEEWSSRGQRQCLVQISTSPVAVCYGVGASEKEARSACAINALEYFRDMLN